MKVLVLGAGVIGTATAWYLAADGHEVAVVDRREAAGLETSFANGGQISAGHAEPWANPAAPAKILKWIWRADAPLLFRLRLDPRQWAWGLRFLYECLPGRTRRNIQQLAAMSLYSRARLQQLRAETGIHYDELMRGILNYYTDEREFERAVKTASLMRQYGLELEVQSIDDAMRIEPALESARAWIVGATYTASDESGDAHLFTANLARLAAAKGVVFHYGYEVRAIRRAGVRIGDVLVRNPQGIDEALAADAYVVALGSYSPLLTSPIGVDLPIYPAKGFSATVDVADDSHAPHVSLTDDGAKIVVSRLGSRLRIAGTAELAGYSTELNTVRCEALIRRAREMFPRAGDWDRPVYWAGLRPSTPSNVPLVGRTRYCNLFLNTGHGTLGWTMGAGSGKALADIISERKPEVDFQFTQDDAAK